MAVAPNGKLYGCTFFDGLYEINPSTGAEQYVGPLAGGTLNSLTFSPDGRLYGADQGNGNLFQISPDNGQMNLIGNLGGPSSGDLVFNGANEIFATLGSSSSPLNDRLVAFNVATGTVRNIGDLGSREVYGLTLENGQLTAYTSDRRKLAIDPNTAKATVVGTVSTNGLIWGAGTKPTTASNPTDDVRQKFLYAASQYSQVGAAITGVQDQGGGVFRQEFERAIMIWNGQQVTVYETKGRSVSPTSPSPNPQPVSGKGVTIRTGAGGIQDVFEELKKKIANLEQQLGERQQQVIKLKNFFTATNEQINSLESKVTNNNAEIERLEKSWNPIDWLKALPLRREIFEIKQILVQLKAFKNAYPLKNIQAEAELNTTQANLSEAKTKINWNSEKRRYEFEGGYSLDWNGTGVYTEPSLKNNNPFESNPLKGFYDPFKGQGWIMQAPGGKFSHIGNSKYGIDLGDNKNKDLLSKDAALGLPVYAMRSGKVVQIIDSYPDRVGALQANRNKANMVLIEHDNGYYSRYLHLQQGFNKDINIQIGQHINAGELLGKMGDSGYSSDPHLHVQIDKNDWISKPFEIEGVFKF